MSIDTEIEGRPATIESAATWLRSSLAAKLDAGAEAANSARRSANSSWNSVAGEEFSDMMSRARGKVDDLADAAREMAGDLERFADQLRACQDLMSECREEARGKGLSVTGFTIHDPGQGPARPPDDFVGTPEEVEAHNRRVAAYDAHQELVEAYAAAQTEAARIDRKYSSACQRLQGQYGLNDHAAWLLSLTELLGDTAAAAIGASIATRRSRLHVQAEDLLTEARRAIDDMQAHPERYLKRKWFFFKALDAARLEADRLAIQGKIDDAADLLRRADDLGGSRTLRFLGWGGKVLGPLGFGLGVYNDYQEGETWTQNLVSQGASAGVGIAAGAGATIAAGAATGALIGSVVPGAGTVVGAAVGTVVGAGVAIFSDGAIDSLFENGPDVGAAWDAGWDALEDTGDAIGSAASSVASTVGSWFD